jgi:YHS domain-containing protein
MIMKKFKTLIAAFSIAALSGALSFAAETPPKADKAKPYPLTTCVVSGEKLGEMGAPYVLTHEGREVKLCCKSCLKDFNKEPAKFVKKIEAAEKVAK